MVGKERTHCVTKKETEYVFRFLKEKPLCCLVRVTSPFVERTRRSVWARCSLATAAKTSSIDGSSTNAAQLYKQVRSRQAKKKENEKERAKEKGKEKEKREGRKGKREREKEKNERERKKRSL